MTNGIVIGLSALLGVWLGLYALPIVTSVIGLAWLISRRPSHAVLAIAILVVLVGSWRSRGDEAIRIPPELELSSGTIGRVADFPKPRADRERVLLEIEELCVGTACIPATGCVLGSARVGSRPLSRGDRIRVEWKVETLPALGSGYRNYVAGFGCSGSALITRVSILEAGPLPFRWLANARSTVTGSLVSAIPGDAGALAAGLVTGDDSHLSPDAQKAFKSTGTAHVTAVSGQNVSLIVAFLSGWWIPRTIRKRNAYHAILILAIWLYAALVGLEPPALRAAIMATLLILGNHTGRKPDPLTLLALTLGGMALWKPILVESVGFWLSALATFGLVMVMPTTLPQGGKRIVGKLLLGPTVAALAAMPLVLVTFHSWTPMTILVNALLGPVMTLAFPITYIFSIIAVTAPSLSGVLNFIPAIVLDLALAIVERMSPIAGNFQVGELGTGAVIALVVLTLTLIVLASPETDRWIAKIMRQ